MEIITKVRKIIKNNNFYLNRDLSFEDIFRRGNHIKSQFF